LVDLAEVAGSAFARAREGLAGHKIGSISRRICRFSASIRILFEQVLFNLLDNAAKYTQPGSEIRLGARREDHAVRIEIKDEGIGHSRRRSRPDIRQILSRPGPKIGSAPAPVWVSPSAAASFRPWVAPSKPPTERTVRARSSRSDSPSARMPPCYRRPARS